MLTQQHSSDNEIPLLQTIKKKIHKINPQTNKILQNTKICPFPPGIQIHSQPLTTIHLHIPLRDLIQKESYLQETILWDYEEQYSDEQLFRNLFVIIVDLLEEKYPTKVKELNAQQVTEIIDSCIAQIKTHHPKYLKYTTEIIEIEQYTQSNDSLIKIDIDVPKHKETIQWDLQNGYSLYYILLTSIDQFVFTYCYENKLDQQYQIIIGNQIRDQILKAFEKRLRKLQLFDDEQELQQEIKYKPQNYLELPSFEPYAANYDIPKNHELNVFFRKYVEFLPQELLQQFGNRPNQKQIVEMSVDQDDIKKFEKELGVNKSKYLDETILQELILKNKV